MQSCLTSLGGRTPHVAKESGGPLRGGDNLRFCTESRSRSGKHGFLKGVVVLVLGAPGTAVQDRRARSSLLELRVVLAESRRR